MFHTIIPIVHAAEAAHEATSTGGISALGIDGPALLYQIINFALLFFLLKRFAFPPIMHMLEQRRQTIEESLKTAEAIEERDQQLRREHAALLKSAQDASGKILADARSESEVLLKEAENKSRFQREQLMADAETMIQARAEEVRSELRREAGHLIAEATKKIIGEKIDEKHDNVLIESALMTIETKGKP
jgi:F-type H+-transporting ATPase subunit b